jgi:hypothetical protein
MDSGGDKNEHSCLHEVDLALLNDTLPRLEGKIDYNMKVIEAKIDSLIQSTLGKDGSTTQIELLKASTKRIWWIFGTVAGALSVIMGTILGTILTRIL